MQAASRIRCGKADADKSWMSRYFSAAKNLAVLDFDSAKGNAEVVGDYCKTQGRHRHERNAKELAIGALRRQGCCSREVHEDEAGAVKRCSSVNVAAPVHIDRCPGDVG
jgi:hypothetical protein